MSDHKNNENAEPVRPSGSSTEEAQGIRVRIVGDGTKGGTKVVNVVTGERIQNVQRIEWAISIDEAPIRARITIRKVEVDMEVDADIVEALV